MTLTTKRDFVFAGQKNTLIAIIIPAKDFVISLKDIDKKTFIDSSKSYNTNGAKPIQQFNAVFMVIEAILTLEDFELFTINFSDTKISIKPIEGKSTIGGFDIELHFDCPTK